MSEFILVFGAALVILPSYLLVIAMIWRYRGRRQPLSGAVVSAVSAVFGLLFGVVFALGDGRVALSEVVTGVAAVFVWVLVGLGVVVPIYHDKSRRIL